MAVQRTKTVKNKHAASKSGISNSKAASKRAPMDGIVRPKRNKSGKTPATISKQVKEKGAQGKKNKRKSYTAEQLGIPTLNMITPVGVEKPKGKKKGKVFVDDRESMNTILSMVQAEKNGQIESKMIKARQMEEIREARKVEAEKKENERKERIEDTKDALRKKRKRKSAGDEEDFKSEGAKAGKSKKRVSFA